jgi:pimeloyl-ACP methyl ester carboxylesterase
MVMTSNKAGFYELFSRQHGYFKWLYQIVSHFYHRFTALQWDQLKNLRLATSPPSKTIEFYSDHLKLVGDFYGPKGKSKAATILLLHGSSIFGRKLALIRALAGEFQCQGYAVFAFDLRGYGESDDPQTNTPEAFNFAQDVQSAIDWLTCYAPESSQQFYVLGHSFGGAVAFAAQAADSRIKKIISFGPPRRLSERFLNPEAREKQKLLLRWQADMQLDRPLTFGLWQQVLEPLNIENYAQSFAAPGHRPVFLIDAEHEPEADLLFLRNFYQGTVPPFDYWTVPGTDHYLGTGFLLGLPCYNQVTVQRFVQRVSQWLQQIHELQKNAPKQVF